MPLIFQRYFLFSEVKLLKCFTLKALDEIPYICVQPDIYENYL